MRKLSEVINNSESKTSIEPIDEPSIDQLEKEVISEITNTDSEFPSYLLTDSNVVGYPDSGFQEEIYKIASIGTFDANTKTIFDVGCGRGDYGHYLKTAVNPDFNYIGVDSNSLLINVGREKYKDSGLNLDLQNSTFDSEWVNNNETISADWVMNIFNLSLQYNNVTKHDLSGSGKYDYFEEILLASMKVANLGTVFILLNENQEEDVNLNNLTLFEFTEISRILFKHNYAFAIDNTDFSGIFKLLVYNNKL